MPVANIRINKALPQIYQVAFGFEQSQTSLFSNDKDFSCSLHGKDPRTTAPPPPKTLSGQFYSVALLQPRPAMGLGLLFEAPVKITPAQIANGGWLFVDFTAGTNPYQAAITANPDLIRTFAAPIPCWAQRRSRCSRPLKLMPRNRITASV